MERAPLKNRNSICGEIFVTPDYWSINLLHIITEIIFFGIAEGEGKRGELGESFAVFCYLANTPPSVI